MKLVSWIFITIVLIVILFAASLWFVDLNPSPSLPQPGTYLIAQNAQAPTPAPQGTAAPAWATAFKRLNDNSTLIQTYAVQPLANWLGLLAVFLAAVLVLALLFSLLRLLFRRDLILDDIGNATNDARLEGVVTNLTARAHYSLVKDLQNIRAIVENHSRRLVGTPLRINQRAADQLSKDLGEMVTSLSELAPGPARPILGLIRMISPVRDTRISSTLLLGKNSPPRAGIDFSVTGSSEFRFHYQEPDPIPKDSDLVERFSELLDHALLCLMVELACEELLKQVPLKVHL